MVPWFRFEDSVSLVNAFTEEQVRTRTLEVNPRLQNPCHVSPAAVIQT